MSFIKCAAYKSTAIIYGLASKFIKSYKERRPFILEAGQNWRLYRQEFQSCIGPKESSVNKIMTACKKIGAAKKAGLLLQNGGAKSEEVLAETFAVVSNLRVVANEIEKYGFVRLAARIRQKAQDKQNGAEHWTRVNILESPRLNVPVLKNP